MEIQEENKIIKPKKKFEINLPISIIISGLIVAGAIVFSHFNPVDDVNNDSSLVPEVMESDFIRGKENAKITIIEYADFSCTYCAVYHPTLKKILDEYDGKVRWVYRHLPIFNIDAAIAGQCIGSLKGDKAFWNFADEMYANREKASNSFYAELASKEGLSAEEYSKCIEDPNIKSKIQSDFSQDRIILGLNATPHTVIIDKNGKEFSFSGALSYENLKSVLDRLVY
ncbi:MAG: thioredoxin domain-containing protein [Bacteroidetes bacterium]|nr:thioredoxin domain-containing protein [Bacteroidota bacterium]